MCEFTRRMFSHLHAYWRRARLGLTERGAFTKLQRECEKRLIMQTRRDFLKLAAMVSGATGISDLVPESVQRAYAIEPAPARLTLTRNISSS